MDCVVAEPVIGPRFARTRWLLAMTAKERSIISRRQRLHLRVEIRLPFKADAGQIRHGDLAILDADAIGKAAIGLEQIRIALIAAEAEAGCNIQRHLVAAMGDAP